MDDLTRRLTPDLMRVQVLSLDVFDTCLLRRVGRPVNVFDMIEHSLSGDPGLHALSGGRLAFHALRPHAEEGARKRLLKSEKTSEVTFDELYDELQRMTGLAPCEIKRLQQMELDSERKLMLANPPVLALAQYAREHGLQVVFISDMYHSREFIADLLNRCGFEVDPKQVFVSSEYRKAKFGNGALFDVVSNALKVPLKRFLHVGDNRDADFDSPRRKGMRAYHISRVADTVAAYDVVDRRNSHLLPRPETSIALGVRDGVLATRLAMEGSAPVSRDFWFKLGYERVGALFLGFAQWLIKQCHDDQIDTMIFLARDGYIMKRVFEDVCRARGLEIASVYMYASRRALVFPSLMALDEHALSLLSSGVNMPVRAYLKRYGLNAERYTYDAKFCGFKSLDDRVKEPEDFDRVKRLFTLIGADVLQATTQEAAIAQRYFDQLQLPRSGHVAIMDVGWFGSTQEGLTKLLRLSGRSTTVTGYYLGLHREAEVRMNRGYPMKGYLTTAGEPEDIHSWMMACIELVEFLLLAPHGSCLGFTERDGQITPVLEDDPTEAGNREKAAAVQEGALKFIEDAIPLLAAFPTLEFDPHGAFYPYAQVIMDPTYEEARTLGDLTHEQNMGQGRWYLANPEALKREHASMDTVFWKAGYQRRKRGH